MDRETLMQEVKEIYAGISQQETRQHFTQTNSNSNPESIMRKYSIWFCRRSPPVHLTGFAPAGI